MASDNQVVIDALRGSIPAAYQPIFDAVLAVERATSTNRSKITFWVEINSLRGQHNNSLQRPHNRCTTFLHMMDGEVEIHCTRISEEFAREMIRLGIAYEVPA